MEIMLYLRFCGFEIIFGYTVYRFGILGLFMEIIMVYGSGLVLDIGVSSKFWILAYRFRFTL